MQTALALGAYGGLVLAVFAALGRLPQKIVRAVYTLRLSKRVREAAKEETIMVRHARRVIKNGWDK